MPQKIAIIGANEQQNPLIVKAREMGCETHTFAWQSGGEVGAKTSDRFYPISAGNKEDILAKCREIGVEAVLSIGSDIAALSAAYVAEALGLPCNSYAAVCAATNKIATRRLFAENGIRQPAFVEIGDDVSFEQLSKLHYPLVVKPCDRSGGRGLRVICGEGEFFSAINQAREVSFARKAIVEEYIEGQLYSCECISVAGMHSVLAYTRREVLSVGSRICEKKHTQPAILPHTVEKRVEMESRRILDILGLQTGASSIEFIVDGEGQVYYLEVSPSMYGDYIGTHLTPATTGVDYLALSLDLALGKPVTLPSASAQGVATVEFFYSAADGAPNAPATPDGERYGHRITLSPLKEFGGCPPFPLAAGEPYFAPAETVLALNSEYTAFWYALRQLAPTCIHLPYYASSAWEKVAAEAGVPCRYYHIDEQFLPTDLAVGEGEAVLLIDHCGLCDGYIRQAPFAKLIVDRSMSFFAPPVMREGVYNIYSCRKFFAVPDGAYLISASLPGEAIPLERDVSYPRAAALLCSLELGEGAAYKERQANEQALTARRASMSRLTENMLQAIDYTAEKEKRKRIFELLHNGLCRYNQIQIDQEKDLVPQFYPLLVEDDIRERLVGRKIYIPLMWRKTLAEAFDGLAEKRFSEKLVCLPISAAYTEEDARYLLETVLAALT